MEEGDDTSLDRVSGGPRNTICWWGGRAISGGIAGPEAAIGGVAGAKAATGVVAGAEAAIGGVAGNGAASSDGASAGPCKAIWASVSVCVCASVFAPGCARARRHQCISTHASAPMRRHPCIRTCEYALCGCTCAPYRVRERRDVCVWGGNKGICMVV